MLFKQMQDQFFSGTEGWVIEDSYQEAFFHYLDQIDPLDDYVVIIDSQGIAVMGEDENGVFQIQDNKPLSFTEAKQLAEQLKSFTFYEWFEQFETVAEKIYY